ncbi:hypothetical protein [uncultured Rossellomorea sp.]|uniref:hypothetical protein n=1 Tax=uncultured Rossellomorea sp. TaxID=2837549 RepID=UPI00262F63F2|nr:hypothetical protein [uncultured Rossellomorea sp.]
MKNFLSGMLFSLLLLLSFIFIRTVAGVWVSFAWSLFITTAVFLFYGRKKKWSGKDIVLISFGTGLFYILFASFGISLVPPEPIRDLGDIVMPYLYAGVFGGCTMIVLVLSGLVINKQR